jgi:hypothetical protein
MYRKKYKPHYEKIKGVNHLLKTEYKMQNFLFQNDGCVTIACDDFIFAPEPVVMVRIEIVPKKTIISALAKDIENPKMIQVYHDESKYHYPASKWKVESGDPNWYQS